MSRSTVQDKISGKSPPRLSQVLALVQACAMYAKSIGAPLPSEDTDERAWRKLVEDTVVRTSSAALSAPFPVDAAASGLVSKETNWDLEPLVRAGMHDMVELVQNNEGQPMAAWLPELIYALELAKMSNVQFLKVASRQTPNDFVNTVVALSNYDDKLVERLMFYCSAYQPADAIPAIVVLLRRRKSAYTAELAEMLIDLISGRFRGGYPTMRKDYAEVVLILRAATLNGDADRLLQGVGMNKISAYIFEIAAALPDNAYRDREILLSSVAKGSDRHLSSVLRDLRNKNYDGIDPRTTLDQILSGIPAEESERIVSYLESEGLNDEARRVLEIRNEPPF